MAEEFLDSADHLRAVDVAISSAITPIVKERLSRNVLAMRLGR